MIPLRKTHSVKHCGPFFVHFSPRYNGKSLSDVPLTFYSQESEGLLKSRQKNHHFRKYGFSCASSGKELLNTSCFPYIIWQKKAEWSALIITNHRRAKSPLPVTVKPATINRKPGKIQIKEIQHHVFISCTSGGHPAVCHDELQRTSGRIGKPLGVSLVVHASGGILLILYILLAVRKKVTLRGMPWYLYSAGFFGVLLVSVSSWCVGILGAAVTTCLSVAGQLCMSAVIDHYGMFHVPKVPFSPKRIPCFLMILAGILLLNLS